MQNKLSYVWIAVLLFSIIAIGYVVEREESEWLIALFGLSFLAYFVLVVKPKRSLKEMLVIGILIRLSLLGATPELSDDYYRFAFDGKMIVNGANPFTILPGQFGEKTAYESKLVEEMNSPNYYTVYPPINQIFFSLPTLIAGENLQVYVVLLRILIVLFEILMALLLLKLLQYLNKELHLFAWYFLNPLVIIELTANLHFEGVTLFFFLLSMYLLMTGKLLRSGVVYAVAIGTKLIPLMFLPFFVHRLKVRSIWFFSVIGLTLFVLFVPFINKELISNIGSSIDLYFHTFMFNGSLFYLANGVAEWFTGFEYNLNLLGSITPGLVFVSILLLSFSKNKSGWDGLFRQCLFGLMIYYAMASIVHPWYVINLMAVALFTNYRFPFVWSALVVLSYVAYGDQPVQEIPIVLLIEYLLLGSMIVYELLSERKKRFRLSGNNGDSF